MFVKTYAVDLIKNSVFFSCSSSFFFINETEPNSAAYLFLSSSVYTVLFSRISIRLQEQNLYAGEFCYVWQQG